MHAVVCGDVAGVDLLALQLSLSRGGQTIECLRNFRHGTCSQFQFNGLFLDHVLIGQAHAVGAQNPRHRMNKHPRHAQRIGHQTSVLATRAAKALQGVARHVIAARNRYFFNRVGHLLHRDVDKAFSHHFRTAARLPCQVIELGGGSFIAQWLISVRAKHFGKVTRLHFADHHVRIGHGQSAPAPVTGRAGVGTSALRAHAKTLAIKFQNRPATRCHGVDAHHGRTHAHPCHLCFKLALKLACIVRHIGRCTTHVETNHFGVTCNRRSACHAHNTTRRAAQYRVFALEHMRVRQATR